MEIRRHIWSLLLCALFAVPSMAAAQFGRGEYLVVSGGPALREWENLRVGRDQHDQWWGNFIRPARVRIGQLKERYGSASRVTWLVHRPSYTARAEEEERPLLSFIRSVQEKYCLLYTSDAADE